MYPDHKWQRWRINERAPQGFWKNRDNQRQFFDWLGTRLGYKEMDDWYNVTQDDIYKHGGSGMLSDYFSKSPSKALQAVHPEHKWIPWKFGQIVKGFWKNEDNHRQF